jgi:hypothetical protein
MLPIYTQMVTQYMNLVIDYKNNKTNTLIENAPLWGIFYLWYKVGGSGK